MIAAAYAAALLCAVLLTGCGHEPSGKVGRWYSEAQVEQGERLFQHYCAECHGGHAQGLAPDWRVRQADGSYPPPPLNGTAHTWHHPLSVLQRVIQEGGAPYDGKMPGFKGRLSEAEQLAIIAWFQHFWSDQIYEAWRETDQQQKGSGGGS